MSQYYKPSGVFSPLSFLYFVIASFIVMPILALIYTYLVWYIPLIYINFLVALGFGFAVGVSISWLVIKVGKVRNVLIAALFGFMGAFFAMYFSWAIWVDLVINSGETIGGSRISVSKSNIRIGEVIQLASEPGKLWNIISEINKIGTWGFRSTAVSGVFWLLFGSLNQL